MIPNDLKEWRLLRQDVPGRVGSAYGIRTRVTGVRGRRPGPLDECATCPKRIPIGPAKGTTDVPERSTRARGWLFRALRAGRPDARRAFRALSFVKDLPFTKDRLP